MCPHAVCEVRNPTRHFDCLPHPTTQNSLSHHFHHCMGTSAQYQKGWAAVERAIELLYCPMSQTKLPIKRSHVTAVSLQALRAVSPRSSTRSFTSTVANITAAGPQDCDDECGTCQIGELALVVQVDGHALHWHPELRCSPRELLISHLCGACVHQRRLYSYDHNLAHHLTGCERQVRQSRPAAKD